MGKKANGARPAAKAHPAHTGSTGPDLDHAEPDRRIGARTLGPVSDLERHLPSDWWRTLFNSLYLETDGDIIENDRNTADEVDLLIRSIGLERNDRILDLCCGQGRHSLELASRGFPNVTGLDRSRYLIRLARKRAKQRNLQVSFHEGDARRFRLGDGDFHCVCILGNSFGYFERPEDDLAVLEAVNRALASGGSLVMDLMDGDWMRHHFEQRSWEGVDQNHFVCRERALAGAGDPRLPDPGKRAGGFGEEDIETIDRLKTALRELPDYRFRFVDNHASPFADLRASRPHFVLNLCDEGFNNDAFMEMHVPALLEMLDIPYSGAGPSCLGLCYNKSLVRGIAQAIDVPVPAETYFNSDDLAATIPSVFPALIKPNYGDSSIGITQDAVVHTWEEAITRLGRLRQQMLGCPILIQEVLTGPEYSIGIIGNAGQGYRVLPPLEVDYSRLDPALPQLLPYAA